MASRERDRRVEKLAVEVLTALREARRHDRRNRVSTFALAGGEGVPAEAGDRQHRQSRRRLLHHEHPRRPLTDLSMPKSWWLGIMSISMNPDVVHQVRDIIAGAERRIWPPARRGGRRLRLDFSATSAPRAARSILNDAVASQVAARLLSIGHIAPEADAQGIASACRRLTSPLSRYLRR